MINWTKNTVIKISGYKSPIKDLYTDFKAVKENKEHSELDLSSVDVMKVTRNLKMTCYILIAVFAYNTYMMTQANHWMDFTFASLIMILATVFYVRYVYSVWIIETNSKASLKEWLSLVRKTPRLLLPL